jgi:hypothetical protein
MGKWLGGIVGAVLTAVLIWWLTEGLRSKITEHGPSTSTPIPAPAPKSSMGQLVYGMAYVGADIRSVLSSSASECAEICGQEDLCKAMTYITSQKLCWLKHSIPATAPSDEMISAAKLGN